MYQTWIQIIDFYNNYYSNNKHTLIKYIRLINIFYIYNLMYPVVGFFGKHFWDISEKTNNINKIHESFNQIILMYPDKCTVKIIVSINFRF